MLTAKRVRRAWLPLAFVASTAFACEVGTVLVAENGPPSAPGGAGGRKPGIEPLTDCSPRDAKSPGGTFVLGVESPIVICVSEFESDRSQGDLTVRGVMVRSKGDTLAFEYLTLSVVGRRPFGEFDTTIVCASNDSTCTLEIEGAGDDGQTRYEALPRGLKVDVNEWTPTMFLGAGSAVAVLETAGYETSDEKARILSEVPLGIDVTAAAGP
jgi:hypothetical protein